MEEIQVPVLKSFEFISDKHRIDVHNHFKHIFLVQIKYQ